MKKFFVCFFYLCLLTQTSLQAYSSDPKNFVSELVNDVISKLSSKNLNEVEKANFVETIALENVDINALSYIL